MKIRAYNNVYNGLKKNDPEYLDLIIKKNNGSKEKLWKFHDFDLLLEGEEMELEDGTKHEFAKNHKKEVDAYKAAYESFAMKRDDLLNRALGYNHSKHNFAGYFITLDDGRVIPLGFDDDFKV